MTAAICITLYALGLGMALRGEIASRRRLGRMAQDLRPGYFEEEPHA